MKKPLSKATGQHVLDFSVAVVDFYFRIEAITEATAGFARAGGEFGVLRMLVLEGAQTVPAMARSRPVSRQHCQTIVNALEAQGFAEFVENPKHKRSHLVRVTKAGRVRFEAMTKQFLGVASTFAPHFSADELTNATDVLRRAREVLVV